MSAAAVMMVMVVAFALLGLLRSDRSKSPDAAGLRPDDCAVRRIGLQREQRLQRLRAELRAAGRRRGAACRSRALAEDDADADDAPLVWPSAANNSNNGSDCAPDDAAVVRLQFLLPQRLQIGVWIIRSELTDAT